MSQLQKTSLGSQELIVPKIGLGCMGMTTIAGNNIYGQADETASIATIHQSLELGGNFLDTADDKCNASCTSQEKNPYLSISAI
jgi:aryl-alcohol dehydrogenase-like predicted oxidoreductase